MLMKDRKTAIKLYVDYPDIGPVDDELEDVLFKHVKLGVSVHVVHAVTHASQHAHSRKHNTNKAVIDHRLRPRFCRCRVTLSTQNVDPASVGLQLVLLRTVYSQAYRGRSNQ